MIRISILVEEMRWRLRRKAAQSGSDLVVAQYKRCVPSPTHVDHSDHANMNFKTSDPERDGAPLMIIPT